MCYFTWIFSDMEVYVIRHTEVDVPAGTCYGQSEVPLRDSFQSEVTQLKSKLINEFDVVYSSPFSRCTRLAEELGYPNCIKDERLCELNFGDWEMMNWADIDREAVDSWSANIVGVRIPNGENLGDMYSRVSVFMQELVKSDYKRILLVTHGGVIRCLWAWILGFPLKNLFSVPVGFGEVFAFKVLEKGRYKHIIRKI